MRTHEQENTPLSDGEILYQRQLGSHTKQYEYRKLLSPAKCRLVERLANKFQYESVHTILLRLLEYPGLRSTFGAGVFSNWLLMKCPEEIAHYLTHILSVWSYIMGPGGTQHLDPTSVELLQGRSPVCCAADYRYISDQIVAGGLFSHIEDPGKRMAAARRALSIPTIIPSLYTAREDTKFLMPSALAIRKLIPDAAQDTIRGSLWNHYRPDPQCSATRDHSTFLQAYRTLWLFAMQHLPDLGEGKPLLDGRGCARKLVIPPETTRQRKSVLAQLALSVGFNTPQIQDLLRAHSSPTSLPPLTSSNGPRLTQRGAGRWKLNACCGMPRESSFMQSRPFMTLHHIDQPLHGGEGQVLTPFAVARNVFQAFLGRLPSLPEQSAWVHGIPSAREEASPLNADPSLVSDVQDHIPPPRFLSYAVCHSSPQAISRNIKHNELGVHPPSSPQPQRSDDIHDCEIRSQRINYTPSFYGSSNNSPHGSPNEDQPQASRLRNDLIALAELDPFMPSRPSTPTLPANPGALATAQPRRQPSPRLGLLGERTFEDPRNLSSPSGEQGGRKAVLYEAGSPAIAYQLPLARLAGVCQVYFRDHPNFWYAVWTEGRLRSVEFAAVPDLLRSNVVITGPVEHWESAQRGHFTGNV